ncbi:hypothetical protein K493DRAFT_259800 [Basidiobolus meristosporus CBS 931.73]|uniref:Uncharacterized protein n=1 Tax=Basidiobolus meristosporus CBS 931.73 TaxID=1314790 RepID=A0A1Y1YE66_9FUNG|nr:hypothetical protein K493DRAFT_259800 [Basidiobolus meristosporus CBS 931.73]|eukprot:ORX96258.1 hypothetical protein K493DRAFT_259800 [Basidiobolus meristosporus CBS 931.73]
MFGLRAMNSVRRFTTSALLREQSGFAERAVPEIVVKKKVGAFRGGLMGLLLGVTTAGGIGYYYLLDEYHSASALLVKSVDELHNSTNKVREYAKKIERVEKELIELKAASATSKDIEKVHRDLKQLYEIVQSEHEELKGHVAGIELDVQSHKSKSN